MPDDLASLLTPSALVRLADAVTLQRAHPYAEGAAIAWLNVEPDRLAARVQGTRPRPYAVGFEVHGDRLGWYCDCPVGQGDVFCKHAAAVALAWLAGRTAAGMADGELPAIRRHLQTLPTDALIELLIVAASDDERLRARLLRAAQRYGSTDTDLADWRAALLTAVAAFGDRQYENDWDETGADGDEALCELADALMQRFDAGGAVPVALVEEAIEALAGCLEYASNRADGELHDRVDTLAELHQRICLRDPPDPEALAARLLELEIAGTGDVWQHAVEHYADVLGPTGCAAHRRLAEAALATARTQPPAKAARVYRAVRDILIDYAQDDGDLDAEIALRAERPDGPSTYLHIAGQLQAAGRSDEALDWTERGLAAEPDRPDWRLQAFAIERYVERQRGAEALALAWSAFERAPDLSGYVTLHGLAVRFGVLDDWRPRALARMGSAPRAWVSSEGAADEGPEQTLRVEALCWEGAFEAAWAAAHAGRCANRVLEKLADASSDSHPDEAATVYRRLVHRYVEQTSNSAYEEAIRRLHKLRPLLDADAFAGYVAELRTRYRLKRNFMKLLDELQAGQPGRAR